MGSLQSHPLPYSAISIVTQIPQTPFLISSKTHISRQFQRLRCRGSTRFSFVVSCGGWRDAEQQRDFGPREARGEGTLGRERLQRECVKDPRGRREEARDERVMCLVWGRGCWVVESRGEGPRGEVQMRDARDTRGEEWKR
ncbi:hypothetical protein OIU84_002725 [Salix udensis]|uniref:Uncharacterized protein n=1 Tax=Salix udensis TaxID=889485 RepID=A0AAD6P5P8_9ROSI|nr:hypothetical protein OIU84_002725 [Salix udensis]